MNKKGEELFASKTIYFIIAMLLISFMLVYNYNSFNKNQSLKLECTDIAIDEIMIQKYIFSCFVYEDQDIDRVIPGIIDISKFNQESYDSCFQFVNKKTSITINDITIGEEIHNSRIINKFVYAYNNGELESSIMKFEFEETEC